MKLRTEPNRTTEKQPPVDVEVLIDSIEEGHLLLRLEENSKQLRIPRYGVKIRAVKGSYTTLSMSEHRAIAYNLI